MLLAKAHQRTDRGLPFSIVSCVVGTFLVLACIALAYIAGVMSGRASAARDNNVRLGYAQPSEQITSAPTDEKIAGVLSPEELEYARALRSDTAQRSKKNVVADKTGAPPKKEMPDQSSLQNSVPVETTVHRQVGTTVESSSSPGLPVLFDYVFQVAAMRTEDSVDALRQRLEGRGMRTRMQREGKMYYVLVLLRGDELRAAEVVQTLDSMRLGKPLIRSRKAVIQ